MESQGLANALRMNANTIQQDANANPTGTGEALLQAGQEGALPAGDRVTLSAEGLSMAEAARKTKQARAGGASESGASSPEDLLIERLKERLEKLEQEIQETRESNLPDEQKQKKISRLEQEKAQLQAQILDLQQKKNGGDQTVGGTDAQGFASSLT